MEIKKFKVVLKEDSDAIFCIIKENNIRLPLVAESNGKEIEGYIHKNKSPKEIPWGIASVPEKGGINICVHQNQSGRILGYLETENGCLAVCSDFPLYLLFIPIFILFVILMCILCGEEPKVDAPNNTAESAAVSADVPKIEEDLTDEWVTGVRPTEEQENIVIPGWSKIDISDGVAVTLINPEGNTVLFKYTIKDNDNILYETDYIPAGKAATWRAWEYFDVAGTYDLKFVIETIDTETYTSCNGSVMDVVAEVYK